MNVIRIMGGLGNQLFQYAFGQIMENHGMNVAYDVSWFENHSSSNIHREYRLNVFDIEVSISEFLSQKTVYERGYSLRYFEMKDCNFVGYWQYLDYYTPCLSRFKSILQIRHIFYTKEYLTLRKLIETNCTVSVHVRRGDYLNTPGFCTQNLRYYLESIIQIPGNILIFSDDIVWCKQMILPGYFNRKVLFVDLVDYLSFDLMSRCTHHIIANSSFSMFAAFLNQKPERIVIYPKLWAPKRTFRVQEKIAHLPKDWKAL